MTVQPYKATQYHYWLMVSGTSIEERAI